MCTWTEEVRVQVMHDRDSSPVLSFVWDQQMIAGARNWAKRPMARASSKVVPAHTISTTITPTGFVAAIGHLISPPRGP